ncbi:hypothetical protein D0S45_19790 [Marinifilum sp. JC120]|nr:hypothetical protein D0S45_19790 [Marinifilum sp. JC120]
MNKKKGFAKIEFMANLEEIANLSGKGHNKKAIYDLLLGAGKITMSYQNFCAYDLNGIRKKRSPAITDTPAVRTVSALPVPLRGDGPHAGQLDSNSSFIHEKNVTEEELDELVGK